MRAGDVGCNGTYRLDHQGNQNIVELEYQDQRFSYQYVIEGNRLTLIDADGKNFVYAWREQFICEGSSMC
jgi:hypothetical protein